MSNGLSYILAVDLGTSGPKVALVSSRGEILACEFEPVKLCLLPGGGAEQSPTEWWSAICRASHRVLDQNLAPIERISALCCTTQWSGTIPVDPGGAPLSDAIIWMDSRGAAHIRRITGGLIELEGYDITRLVNWVRLTGGIPGQAGKDPIAHILYIKHECPELYAAAYKFLEPKDYLNLRLTGQYAATYDSICLHWITDNRDLRRVDYHPRLLAYSTLDRAKLPDLVRSVDILGPILPEAAADLGLGPKVQVIAGSPDIQSTAIGSGAVRDFEAHLYLGTSSWLACHVPYKKTDLLHNMASLPSARPDRYLLTNEQECAGGCLTYLIDNQIYADDGLATCPKPADIYARINQVAANAQPGSGKLLFLPWLYGERTPVDDHTLRGGYFNQALHTSRAEQVRAVFEGVAYNTRWMLGYVEKFIKRRLDAIHAVGGGAQSDLWCQIHADVLDRPVRQMKDPVLASVRGAAFIASVAMGYAQFDDIHQRVEVAQTYYPQTDNRPIYNELYREYLNIYKATRRIYARLNGSTRIRANQT